jgi:Ca2+-binding EF-hand superfamily protein
MDETEANIRLLFSKLDKDGDGRLSKQELEAGLVALGLPTSKRVLERFWKTADVNRNGYIELQEFDAVVRLQTSRLRKAFDEIAQKDGVITCKYLHDDSA